MRTRSISLLALSACLLLLAGLALPSPPAEAGSGCARSYRVRYGDTLLAIAWRYRTTVSALAALNGIHNPDLIYAGQVLCLPAAPAPKVAPAPRIVVEAAYNYTPLPDEASLPMAQAGELSKELAFPLESIAAFQTVTTVDELFAAVQATRKASIPVLWLQEIEARTASQPAHYLMVSGGAAEPLAGVLISDTARSQPFTGAPTLFQCPRQPVGDVLREQVSSARELTLWLETPENVRYPFHVNWLAHVETIDQLKRCFRDNAVLAVMPGSRSGGYGAIMVQAPEGQNGPPGTSRWKARCSNWRARRGFYYRWLRAWYACR